MKGILQTIGILAIAKVVFGALATNVMDRVTYGFGGLKISDFNFFEETIKLRLVIVNNNPVPITIKRFTGILTFGTISTPVQLDEEFTAPKGEQVVASFSTQVSNGLLLQQVAALIESGTVPQLKIAGTITAGIRDKVLTVNIAQTLPIL